MFYPDYMWDPNDDEKRVFEKFTKYYGEFSDDVRDGLLARNINLPSNVFDVLYPESRKKLLSRNVPSQSDVLEDSEQHRQNALAKIVPNITNLEELSKAYREAQFAKNVVNETSILEISERHRLEQLAKNEDIKTEPHISKSKPYRDSQLAKNVPKKTNVEDDAEKNRADQLSKNVPKQSDVEATAQEYRDNQLANNVPQQSDVENTAEAFRRDQLGKNVPQQSDLEETAAPFREDQLGKNVPQESDLEETAAPFREDQLGKNVPQESDLEETAAPFREDQLGKNVPQESDLEETAAPFREDQLGKNVPQESDLEETAAPFREDQLGNNVASESDLETDSEPFRDDQLSNNVAQTSDIESFSEPFREDQLGNNVPSQSDLETDSVPFREDDLSNNVASESDLEEDSVPYREDDLSNNVPSPSDIETDSVPFREDDLSYNVPSESDLEEDSIPYREEDLANNVPSESDLEEDSIPYREEDLANNVPSESDLEEDSIPYREEDLANNVPSESDLEEDSIPYREEDLANNVPSESDLEEDSIPYREEDLANNVPSESDLEEDSNPYRNEMIANNVTLDSDILNDTEVYREEQLSKNPAGLFGVNIEGFGTQAFVGISRNYAFGIAIREALLARNRYQPGFLGLGGSASAREYNPTLEDGLRESNFITTRGTVVKDDILTMHLKNGQNSIAYRSWSQNELRTEDEVQAEKKEKRELYYSSLDEIPTQKLITDNGYTVFPSQVGGGTPKNATSVIDKIRNNQGELGDVPFAGNYVRGQRDFTITVKDGKSRNIHQRFSITNEYAGKDAGSLIFSITNYAIDNAKPGEKQLRTIYFPPYIQSFQETEIANWNENLILGRPEPVYTYNNSLREGSINFYVLTDFAQEIDLGFSNTEAGLVQEGYSFQDFRFTDLDDEEGSQKLREEQYNAETKNIEDRISKNNQDILELENILNESTASDQAFLNATTQERIDLNIQRSLNASTANALREENIRLKQELAGRGFGFTEGGAIPKQRFSENIAGKNIYGAGMKTTQEYATNDPTVSNIRSAQEVLDELKQNLAFQPAYFSGDKIDFRRRMSFLSKLTRPREKGGDVQRTGFSFTTPPVAHIKLGDWLDHDVVVKSINKDYSDTVWCLEAGSVQPMWSLVTIQFVILGSYGSPGTLSRNPNKTRPLTASDVGGYYGPREVW